MKDVGEEKIGESDEELEIESEEKARGEKIEIDEDRLPSRAMAIHEHIRQDGEKEMERDAMALFWSAIAAGLLPPLTFAGLKNSGAGFGSSPW